MIDKNSPAFPQSYSTGLTKREYFAAKAMQGFCAHADIAERTAQQTSAWAVEQADALIAALNGETPND